MEPHRIYLRDGYHVVLACSGNKCTDQLHAVGKQFEPAIEERVSLSEYMPQDGDNAYNTIGPRLGENSLPRRALPVLVYGEHSSWRDKEGESLDSSYYPIADSAQSSLSSVSSEMASAGVLDSAVRFDAWTRAGLTVTDERDLVESTLSCEYIPFSLLCSGPFLRDYLSGAERFCSSALVNALLGLATYVQHTDKYASVSKQQNYPQRQNGAMSTSPLCTDGGQLGQAFFREARQLLTGNCLKSLPDVQAVGILSLYELACGRESEARALAELFCDAITGLCLRRVRDEGAQYRLVRATTYCAAISLIRLLKITAVACETLQKDDLEDDFVVLDLPSHSFGPALAFVSEASQSQQPSAQTINSARIFQLAEWVYKYLISVDLSAEAVATVGGNEVMAVYRNCLDWYEAFRAFAELQDSSSPSILFSHIYFQFCLICIFRPCINISFEDYELNPQQICLEAAQSIIRLVEAYGRLNGGGRLPLLVPRFFEVASLLCTTIDESVSP